MIALVPVSHEMRDVLDELRDYARELREAGRRAEGTDNHARLARVAADCMREQVRVYVLLATAGSGEQWRGTTIEERQEYLRHAEIALNAARRRLDEEKERGQRQQNGLAGGQRQDLARNTGR